jgi:hypothetical protein
MSKLNLDLFIMNSEIVFNNNNFIKLDFDESTLADGIIDEDYLYFKDIKKVSFNDTNLENVKLIENKDDIDYEINELSSSLYKSYIEKYKLNTIILSIEVEIPNELMIKKNISNLYFNITNSHRISDISLTKVLNESKIYKFHDIYINLNECEYQELKILYSVKYNYYNRYCLAIIRFDHQELLENYNML